MRALQLCSEPGCRARVPAGRCVAHQRVRAAWQHTATSTERMGTNWPALKRQVLKEEKRCRKCDAGGKPWVDHIVPRAEGGTDERSNLQRLCDDCHKEKTEQERRRGLTRAAAQRQGVCR